MLPVVRPPVSGCLRTCAVPSLFRQKAEHPGHRRSLAVGLFLGQQPLPPIRRGRRIAAGRTTTSDLRARRPRSHGPKREPSVRSVSSGPRGWRGMRRSLRAGFAPAAGQGSSRLAERLLVDLAVELVRSADGPGGRPVLVNPRARRHAGRARPPGDPAGAPTVWAVGPSSLPFAWCPHLRSRLPTHPSCRRPQRRSGVARDAGGAR